MSKHEIDTAKVTVTSGEDTIYDHELEITHGSTLNMVCGNMIVRIEFYNASAKSEELPIMNKENKFCEDDNS